ncbi:MAG: hypothetical protein ACRD8Z_16090 [Nitrososphaeraceae archaeon]
MEYGLNAWLSSSLTAITLPSGFTVVYKAVGPNKATSLVWGQWDLNIAGKWVQLQSFRAALLFN